MKLEVGMYVKILSLSKITYIGKIVNINEYREKKYCIDIQASDYVFISKEDIVKASHNLIDLIEIGDYVNGYKINNKYITVEGEVIVKDECMDDYYSTSFNNKMIESIVTKEQFENDKYKVGEDK